MTPTKVDEATMPANNLPKMPDGLSGQQRYLASEYGYACYLAGIADAKACVPKHMRKIDGISVGWNVGFNNCRNLTLANLDALGSACTITVSEDER